MKRRNMAEDWRKMLNAEIDYLCRLPSIDMKIEKNGLERHIACIGDMRNSSKILS
jgi:hypothetical protein